MILLEVFVGDSVLRFSAAPYAHSTAPGEYRERLLDISWLERSLFGGAAPFGPLGRGRGRMALSNLDGHLDWLASAPVDGQTARLLFGEADSDYGCFVPVFTGLVEQTLIGDDRITLVLCDPLEARDDLAAIEHEAASAGAWIGFDAQGRYRLRGLRAPETMAPEMVVDAEPEPLYTSRAAMGQPVHRVEVRGLNTLGLWSDPAVKARYPLAGILRVNTSLSQADAADSLARRLGRMFGQPRRRWRTSQRMTPALAALDLGMVVAVGGARRLVTGLALAPISCRLEVTLWG